jgi:pimeloyl-ACP methyl ester carboxylesterase
MISTNFASNIGIGGKVEEYIWTWDQQLRVTYETLGTGSPLLLLPAFSTVSTRQEMRELAKLLSAHFQVIALDWIGFGESSRPSLDYKPAIYQRLIEDFVTSFDTPISVIAAGHAAGYTLQLANKCPTVFSRIVLVAPTWHGPLAVMGLNQKIRGLIRVIVRSPILGQLLYKLNTTPSFLSFMYRSHVFADPAILTPNFIAEKWQTTQKPGARYAPAAFVTGNLDPVDNQSDFLTLARISVPLMVVIGESTPKKSRMEMDALSAIPGVESVVLPGSLGLHEEYPDAVNQAVLPFLKALS